MNDHEKLKELQEQIAALRVKIDKDYYTKEEALKADQVALQRAYAEVIRETAIKLQCNLGKLIEQRFMEWLEKFTLTESFKKQLDNQMHHHVSVWTKNFVEIYGRKIAKRMIAYLDNEKMCNYDSE